MKAAFRVSKTQPEIEQIICSKTEEWDPQDFRLWVPESVAKSTKRYYGSVVENRFKIIPLVPGRNFFTPVIVGKTEKVDDNVTQVVCSVHSSPFAYPAIGSCVLIATLSFASEMVKLFSGELCTLDDWLHPVGACILMFAFWASNHISKKKHFVQFINFIKEVM